MNTVPITDIAHVIRSKNAGPYLITFDILIRREKDYQFLKSSGFFTKRLFADLYGVGEDRVLNLIFFDPAQAVKLTMVRPRPSGDPGDSDIYGAQQHAPLLGLRVPAREGSSR